jgi:FkbH-like protein
VFQKHPEMLLRLEDIACFVANWDDKASNLARIAAELNIGLSSLVFVDDNPVERSIVRRLRPEVAVPELPADPSCFIMALERQRYFQTLTVSVEDLNRTDYYRADAARQTAVTSAVDLEGFLKSLEMTARIGPITHATIERSVQLIHRSNQFNLTTRRHSAAEVQSIMVNDSWLTLTVSLLDKFGDNGLISVLLACIDRDALLIDTWLMSCRVLKRGVEQFLLNYLGMCARDRGLVAIKGDYIPTAKNGLVRDHYASLGFSQIGQIDDSGRTKWELRLDDGWKPLPTFVKESHKHGPDSR